MTEIADRLAELQTAADQARDAHTEVTDEARWKRVVVAREVTQPLRDFQATYNPLRRTTAHVEEEQRLTADLLKEVKKRGLVFIVQTTSQGFGFGIEDPSIDADLAAALKARNTATQALSKFQKDNAEAMREEADHAEAAAFREAVDAGDLDTARRILNGEPETPDALTTDEFKQEKEQRTFIGDEAEEGTRLNDQWGGVPVRLHGLVGASDAA